jgi:hypothetical protein
LNKGGAGGNQSALNRFAGSIAFVAAAMMPSASNALYAVIDIRDKQGVCHQLVNDRNFDWIEE